MIDASQVTGAQSTLKMRDLDFLEHRMSIVVTAQACRSMLASPDYVLRVMQPLQMAHKGAALSFLLGVVNSRLHLHQKPFLFGICCINRWQSWSS
jgi:hypothetical protein